MKRVEGRQEEAKPRWRVGILGRGRGEGGRDGGRGGK